MMSVAANASMYCRTPPISSCVAFGVQVTADRRQRHVDNRHVNHVHERTDDHDHRGEPAPGVTGLRGLAAGDDSLTGGHFPTPSNCDWLSNDVLSSTNDLVKQCSILVQC